MLAVLCVEVGRICSVRGGNIRGDAITCIFPSWRLVLAVPSAYAEAIQLLVELPAVLELAAARCARPRVEGVLLALAFARLHRHASQWGPLLIVRKIALSRVGKEWEHGGHPLRAGGLARRDGDEEFHEVVVDSAASALHDVDILLSHRLAHFHPRLAHAEFGEVDVGGRDAEMGADGVDEAGVGGAREEDQITDHLGGDL